METTNSSARKQLVDLLLRIPENHLWIAESAIDIVMNGEEKEKIILNKITSLSPGGEQNKKIHDILLRHYGKMHGLPDPEETD